MKQQNIKFALILPALLVLLACKEKTTPDFGPTPSGTPPVAEPMVSVEGKKFHCRTSRSFASDGGSSYDISFKAGKFARVETTFDETDPSGPKEVVKKASGAFTEDVSGVKAGSESYHKKDALIFLSAEDMKAYSADNQVIKKIDAALEKANNGGGETPGIPREIQYCSAK